MSLSSTTARIQYSGNGATTVFSFPYYFLQNADLLVILTDASGNETTQAISSQYTVTGATVPAGGSVTMVTAPATGSTLTIIRNPSPVQPLTLIENDPLPVVPVCTALDLLTMLVQRLKDQLARTMTLPDGLVGSFDPTIPPSMLVADTLVMVNDAGTGFAPGPSGASIAEVADNAAAVAADAAAAATSASNAAASATAAASSATATASSAVAASNSAVSAATSASSAAASAAVSTARPDNLLLDSGFEIWPEGTSFVVVNGAEVYGSVAWYAKNSLGTNGQITMSQVADSSDYACSMQITHAPTAAQDNGCELYQTLENRDSMELYNQTASLVAQIKALGNVTQIGLQFFYASSETKVTTAIGSEVLCTVTSLAFVSCPINGQALGTSMTTSGVIGVRIRPTQVSSGNLYDVNNGFIAKRTVLSVSTQAATFWQRAGKTLGGEITLTERFYEKTYDLTVAPGANIANGAVAFNVGHATSNQRRFHYKYRTAKRSSGSLTYYDEAGNGSRVTTISADGGTVTNNQSVTNFDRANTKGFSLYANASTVGGWSAHFVCDARI